MACSSTTMITTRPCRLLLIMTVCIILTNRSADAWGSRPSLKTTTDTIAPSVISDPMGLADSSSKSGGCPFLVSNVDSGMWDVPALFNEKDSRPIVLFGGPNKEDTDDLRHNNAAVQLLLKHDSCRKDPRGNLRFAPLQSQVGNLLCRRMSDKTRDEAMESQSIIVCAPNETYTQSNAALFVGRALGGWRSPIRYLSLLAYALPAKFRNRIYGSVVSRRQKRCLNQQSKSTSSSNTSSDNKTKKYDNVFDQRFVDDKVLTGGKPSLDVEAAPAVVKGDRVRIVWPVGGPKDGPTVTYDDTIPDGLCMVGGTATVATVDLPLRIVVEVDRASLGLEPDGEYEGNVMYAWVKPSEVTLLEEK